MEKKDYAQKLIHSDCLRNVVDMLGRRERLLLRHLNPKVAATVAGNFYMDQS